MKQRSFNKVVNDTKRRPAKLSAYENEIKRLESLLFALNATASPSNSHQIEKTLTIIKQIATLHLQNNNAEKAIANLDQCITVLTSGQHSINTCLFVEMFELRAESYQHIGFFNAALSDLNTAISLAERQKNENPERLDLLIIFANLQRKHGLYSTKMAITLKKDSDEEQEFFRNSIQQASSYFLRSIIYWNNYLAAKSPISPSEQATPGIMYYELGELYALNDKNLSQEAFEYALIKLEKALKKINETQRDSEEVSTIKKYMLRSCIFLISYHKDRENYRYCIELAEKMIALEPNYQQHIYAFKTLLDSYSKINNDEELFESILKMRHLTELHRDEHPADYVDSCSEMARIYYQYGQFTFTKKLCDQAIDFYQRALTLDPVYSEQIKETKALKARALIGEKLYAQASKIYEALIKEEPRGEYYFQRGLCLLQIKLDNDAIGAFRLSVKHWTSSNDQVDMVYCIYMLSHIIRHTIITIQKTTNVDTAKNQTKQMQKEILLVCSFFERLTDKHKKQVSDEFKLEFDPSHIMADTYLLLARFYAKQYPAYSKETKQYYVSALSESIFQTDNYYIEYADYLGLSKSQDTLLNLFENAQNPVLIKYYAYRLGQLFFEQQNFSNAEMYYYKALSQDSVDATDDLNLSDDLLNERIHTALGETYFQQEQWQLSLAHYQQGTLNTRHNQYQQAMCYFHLKQLDNALKLVNEALQTQDNPQEKEAFNTLKAKLVRARGVNLPAIIQALFAELSQFYPRENIVFGGSALLTLIDGKPLSTTQDLDFRVIGETTNSLNSEIHYKSHNYIPYLYEKTKDNFSVDCYVEPAKDSNYPLKNLGSSFLTLSNIYCNDQGMILDISGHGLEDLYNHRLVSMNPNPLESLINNPEFFFHIFKYPEFTRTPEIEQAMQDFNLPDNPLKRSYWSAKAKQLIKDPLKKPHVIHSLYRYNLFSKLFGISNALSEEEAIAKLNELSKRSPQSPKFFRTAYEPPTSSINFSTFINTAKCPKQNQSDCILINKAI